MMSDAVPEPHCPADEAMSLVAHKWMIRILFALHEAGGPVRFRQLQRSVSPISQKELTKRLREAERTGLVHRRVFAEVPPRVEYRLTELGLTLIPSLTALHEWASRYGELVSRHWRSGEVDSVVPEADEASDSPGPRTRIVGGD